MVILEINKPVVKEECVGLGKISRAFSSRPVILGGPVQGEGGTQDRARV